jgi:hypothetical protein
MKTAFCSIVFAIVSLWSFSVFGQGTCHKGGNVQPYPNAPAAPYGAPGGGVYNPVQNYGGYPSANQLNTATYPTTASPAVPTARITVVSASMPSSLPSIATTPAAKLTVVADDVPTAPKATEIVEEKPDAIDSKIASLVGTWKAVARKSDGELTTVELHLDNRGWAELTVPDTKGKPSTTKSRVNLENEELKLTGSDKVVSLGKLVEFNTRQMVLERAEGQVTFVRL